jgi:hypothetical protein
MLKLYKKRLKYIVQIACKYIIIFVIDYKKKMAIMECHLHFQGFVPVSPIVHHVTVDGWAEKGQNMLDAYCMIVYICI